MDIPSTIHLTSAEVAQLDPYVFLAVLGKRVIHPGGRRSSKELFRMTRLSYLRKMAWLMPRLQRAVPFLGYMLIVGEKKASAHA